LASQILNQAQEELSLFQEHKGEYQAPKLSETEARCFELMLHGESCKPLPRVLTDALYNTYLVEARVRTLKEL